MNFQEGLSCGGAYVKLLSQADTLNLVGVLIIFGKMVEILLFCRRVCKRKPLIQ